MNFWQWIQTHPQRTASLLLAVFTQIQGSLALAQLPLPPLAVWAFNSVISIVMVCLAWAVKNTTDTDSTNGVEK